MRKRVRIILSAVAGLLLLAVLGVFVWYRTGGADRYLEGLLRDQLAQMNVRMEVERTTLGLRPGSVVLDNLRLYPGDETDPVVAVDRVDVRFDVLSYFAPKIELRSLDLARPVVTIRFDENGRSNLDAIEWPERKEGERTSDALGYQTAALTIHDGVLVYGDAQRTLDGTIENLAVSVTSKGGASLPGAEPAAHRVELSFSGGKISVDGRELADIGAQLGADVTADGATVDAFSLETPAGTATAQGTITNWRDPQYDFEIGSTVSLERIGYLADPNAGVTGRAGLQGHLTGHGAAYHFDGDLKGNDVLVAGVRIADVSSSGQLQGERLDYAWIGRLIASRVVAAGVDASGLAFDGRIEGSGPDASAEGTFGAERIAGKGFTATGLSFRGRVRSADRTAAGDVGLASIAVRTVRAGSIRAKITADAETIGVPSFTAVVYGGSVSGSATARLAAGGRSTLSAEFRGVDIDQALGASTPDAPRVNGRATGKVELTWPGANLQAANGTIHATVDGSVPSEAEGEPAIPLAGEVAITAVPGSFRIDRAEFTSGASRLSATGVVGWNRASDLELAATADNGADLFALVSAANPSVGEAIRKSNVTIGGAFGFRGRLTGMLKDPNVVGSVQVGQVAVNGATVGAFTGDVRREGGALVLENAKLVGETGGEIAFGLTLPSKEGELQTVTATVTRYPFDTLTKMAPFPPPLFIQGLGGLVSGAVDLRIPAEGGADTATGSVDVSVEGATANGEPVREMRFAAKLGAEEIALSDLSFVTARGALRGTGVIGRGAPMSFRLNFDAKDVDLRALQPAPAEGVAPAVIVAGTASGTLAISGEVERKTFALTVRDLTADAAGVDVVVNNQPVGSPHLAVTTGVSDGKRVANVRVDADIRGTRRELAGVIFIDENDQPFRFSTTLEHADLARLAATPPEGVKTSVTGSVTVGGYLADLTSDNGILDRLSVAGDFSELRLDLNAGGVAYALANRGQVKFDAVEGALRFQPATFVGEGTELALKGDLAIRPEAASNLTLSGDVNLALLSSFSRDAFAGGVATLSASVAGTLADPRFSGFADVRDASLRVIDLPIAIQNGNGRILFTANQALIESFTAQSNGGRVRVDGGVLFAGLRPDRWRFGIDAEQIRVTYPEDVRSVIDGRLTLQGNEQLQVLAGNVDLRRAEYTTDVELSDLIALDEQSGTARFRTGNGGRGTSPIRLDLTVEARDSIVIRNNLADVVASASLALSGPSDDPIIDGRATVTRGTINFRNGEYQVTRGVARFPGRLGGDITFDLQAESEIKGYRVSIGLSGTPAKPYPVLRSEPPLPETQIVSLILTGDLGADQVTTQAVAQSGVGLASSLLGEAVSRSVEKRTSKLFGINRFQIDPLVGGSNPSARLTLGRQVNRNLSIIYSTTVSSGQEQVVQIEYRISNRFSVVATRDERGAFGLDFRVQKRF